LTFVDKNTIETSGYLMTYNNNEFTVKWSQLRTINMYLDTF